MTQPLAYHDLDFLNSSEARPLRILAEYLEPQKRFKDQNIQDTVVFFGSARTLSREGAELELTRLGTDEAKKAADYEAALKRGQKALEWSRYYEDARRLAHMLTVWSLSLEASLAGYPAGLVASRPGSGRLGPHGVRGEGGLRGTHPSLTGSISSAYREVWACSSVG